MQRKRAIHNKSYPLPLNEVSWKCRIASGKLKLFICNTAASLASVIKRGKC
jgi:hypothetical protein